MRYKKIKLILLITLLSFSTISYGEVNFKTAPNYSMENSQIGYGLNTEGYQVYYYKQPIQKLNLTKFIETVDMKVYIKNEDKNTKVYRESDSIFVENLKDSILYCETATGYTFFLISDKEKIQHTNGESEFNLKLDLRKEVKEVLNNPPEVIENGSISWGVIEVDGGNKKDTNTPSVSQVLDNNNSSIWGEKEWGSISVVPSDNIWNIENTNNGTGVTGVTGGTTNPIDQQVIQGPTKYKAKYYGDYNPWKPVAGTADMLLPKMISGRAWVGSFFEKEDVKLIDVAGVKRTYKSFVTPYSLISVDNTLENEKTIEYLDNQTDGGLIFLLLLLSSPLLAIGVITFLIKLLKKAEKQEVILKNATTIYDIVNSEDIKVMTDSEMKRELKI